MNDETPDPPSAAPYVVANRYAVDLDALVGAGGMALVYRGRDLRTRREVALKTLRIEYRRDPDTRARFRREMRTLAFLKHPNVVSIFDICETDEAPWAVMEYVPGQSLKELVQTGGRLDLEMVASLLEQIADALHYLHEHGLVHLDVKPQNLIVQSDGVVKLIDFGLAQPSHRPQELIGGATFGTASYLSPEQASGEPVDAQTDVYALGCVAYELITGHAPFDDPSGEARADVVRAHLEDEPVPPSETAEPGEIPPWIDAVVLGALAKRPGDRYRDAPTFAAFFRSAVDDAAGTRTGRSGVAGADSPETVTVTPQAPIRTIHVEAAYQDRRPRWLASPMLRRWLWRTVFLLLLLDLLLALLVVLDRGELPPIIRRPAAIETGTVVRVQTDLLNFRAEAGQQTAVIDLARFGDRFLVTGPAEMVDNELWWPVSPIGSDHDETGYLWAGGIEPSGTGMAGRLQKETDRIRQAIGQATGWTP